MKSSEKDQVDISQHILENIPAEAEVTRIEYEGPALAVYTKKPEGEGNRQSDDKQASAICDLVERHSLGYRLRDTDMN